MLWLFSISCCVDKRCRSSHAAPTSTWENCPWRQGDWAYCRTARQCVPQVGSTSAEYETLILQPSVAQFLIVTFHQKVYITNNYNVYYIIISVLYNFIPNFFFFSNEINHKQINKCYLTLSNVIIVISMKLIPVYLVVFKYVVFLVFIIIILFKYTSTVYALYGQRFCRPDHHSYTQSCKRN